MASTGRFRPRLWWVEEYPDWVKDALGCRESGLEVVNPMPRNPAAGKSAGPKTAAAAPGSRGTGERIRALAAEKIKRGVWLSYLYHTRRLRRLLDRTAGIISSRNIRLLVIPEDNVGGPWPAVVEAGRRAGAPAVIIPFTVAGPSEFAEAYRFKPDFQLDRRLNRLLAKRRPEWVYDHHGLKLVRLPAGWAWALIRLGLAPPEPWVLHSGRAAAIAVESDRMKEHYLSQGLEREKLAVTGGPTDDILARGLKEAARKREELYLELGLPANRPLALLALPPDVLHLNRPECDFQDYDLLAAKMLAPLAENEGWNVVVSPHPHLDESRLTNLAGPNVGLSARPTAELIPLSDVYVASISATIRWAVACGKPIINYDVYRYRYNDFDALGGVLNVEEYEDYERACRELTGRPERLAELSRKQSREAPRWGLLDGRSQERILDLFERLIENEGKPILE